MRNITAVPVVWASAVSAQRVGGLCLQKDGITLSGSVISVLRKRDNFRWTVILFQDDDKLSDPNSCFQPSVERNFKIALLLNWCFLLKRKTQHLSQPIRWKVKHKYYLSTDSIPALLVSLVYWVKNTVHCFDWSVKELWVLKNTISLPSSTTVNLRVRTWNLLKNLLG